jgi:hypothetical protein
VGVVAALAASAATLSLSGTHLTIELDAASAGVWAGLLATGAGGVGAALESAPGRGGTAMLAGGIVGYLWALALLVVGVLVIATLEPQATRVYVDGLRGFGASGAAWFGAHVLSLPTQSAVLLVPASGSCLDLLATGSTAARLCPWNIDAISPLAKAFLPTDPLELSAGSWILVVAPSLATLLGGYRAGSRQARIPAIVRGVGSGVVFAALGVLGAAFASPRIEVPALASWLPLEVSTWSLRAAGLLGLWGVIGGAIGGWLAGRAYDDPGLPRPTSA